MAFLMEVLFACYFSLVVTCLLALCTDAKKVLTLWTLLGGAVAVLLWGFFSFPRKCK
jgi:hypothetical protein